MKGYRLILTLLIAATFALGTIGCDDKAAATPEAPAEGGEAKPDEAKPDEAKPDEAKPDEAKPAATNGAAADGAAAEGDGKAEPEGGAESGK